MRVFHVHFLRPGTDLASYASFHCLRPNLLNTLMAQNYPSSFDARLSRVLQPTQHALSLRTMLEFLLILLLLSCQSRPYGPKIPVRWCPPCVKSALFLTHVHDPDQMHLIAEDLLCVVMLLNFAIYRAPDRSFCTHSFLFVILDNQHFPASQLHSTAREY